MKRDQHSSQAMYRNSETHRNYNQTSNEMKYEFEAMLLRFFAPIPAWIGRNHPHKPVLFTIIVLPEVVYISKTMMDIHTFSANSDGRCCLKSIHWKHHMIEINALKFHRNLVKSLETVRKFMINNQNICVNLKNTTKSIYMNAPIINSY